MAKPYDKYELVIGLELHLQLSTRSKAFCADDARFGGEPNTHISVISLGHPGTLPRPNRKHIEYAVRLGLALGCRINRTTSFDRKNYFYADLPKGYQITQDRHPVCIGGGLEIPTKNGPKFVRIHHIHMEEDAGKSIHDLEPKASLIDLNRAGVPLLEIVTEPDLRSPDEVDRLMSSIRQLARYLEISDGNMEEGSLRCDVNVSVRPKGSNTLNERCEIKNINSMQYARRAIQYERKRQIDLIERGGKVRQQTLNFDPATGQTSPLRDKEHAHDYRYFPEPDLPPIVLTETFIKEIQESLPLLPEAVYRKLRTEYGLSEADALLIAEEKDMAEYYFDLARESGNHKSSALLLINKIRPFLQEHQMTPGDFPVSIAALAAFIDLVEQGKVSSAIAYQRLFPALLNDPGTGVVALAEKLGLIQRDDGEFLDKLVDEAIARYPDKAAAYKKGKKNLLGLFMGEVMRRSNGQANPQATSQLLKKKLAE